MIRQWAKVDPETGEVIAINSGPIETCPVTHEVLALDECCHEGYMQVEIDPACSPRTHRWCTKTWKMIEKENLPVESSDHDCPVRAEKAGQRRAALEARKELIKAGIIGPDAGRKAKSQARREPGHE